MANIKSNFFYDFVNYFLYILTLYHLQRRRGSKDAAGDEKSEWERRLDKPSVPLKAIGDPGPPKIVEIQEKYGAVEGK